MEKFFGRIVCPWFAPIRNMIIASSSEFRNHYLNGIWINRLYICKNCQEKGLTHIHHLIPLSIGGSHKNKNFIELCPSCHKKVENGIIEIKENGKYNYRLLKKERKILLKIYKNQNLFEKEVIQKHLLFDCSIKYLIKEKLYERLNEFIRENKWKSELKLPAQDIAYEGINA